MVFKTSAPSAPVRVAVVPAWNEERTVGSVILQARDHVDRIVVVDDGSTDDTAAVAGKAGADVVPHDANRGKGAAIRTGLDVAAKHDPDVVVLLDADGQHDPTEIPRIVAPIEDGDADVVVGSRTRPGDGRASRSRRTGRRALDKATNVLSKLDLQDTQSGYRAFRGDRVDDVRPREAGMGVESEMLLRAARADLEIVEVPVADHYPDEATPRVRSHRHAGNVLAGMLRFVREEHPLAFFGGTGAVLLAIGLVLGYQTATLYYGTGLFAPGKAMLAMLFVILGSVALMGAMILDFVALNIPSDDG